MTNPEETVHAIESRAERGIALPDAASYKVYFYEREYGDLADVVAVDSFDTGVQLVRNRLPRKADYEVQATWTAGTGEMEVRTPHGTVLARVQIVSDLDVALQPKVLEACAALQLGDAAPLEHLFAPLLEAA